MQCRQDRVDEADLLVWNQRKSQSNEKDSDGELEVDKIATI
jgi:hypothetical protein